MPWREVIASRDAKPGTCLTITNLIDRWTPERFERLELALSRLVDPGVGKDQFQIRVAVNGGTQHWIKPAIDSLKPMYSIQGHVVRGGCCKAIYRDINGVEEQWERSVVWPEGPDACGPFSFRINAWDLDRDAFAFYTESTGLKLGIRDFRRLIRDHSGISLYRDGFRILPYGEPDNDWLRLDRRRVNNPTMRLSNNQILGVLNLTADDNPALKDQTNREGLVTNDAYDHVHAVVLELLGYLETRRFISRRSIGLKSNQKAIALDVLNGGPDATIEAALERLRNSAEDAGAPLAEIREFLSRQREQAADAIRNYAGWAAAGQMTGLIVKQLEHPLRQARSEISLLIEECASRRTDGPIYDELTVGLTKLSSLFDEISKRVNGIAPLAFGRLERRACAMDLQAVVNDVLRVFLEALVSADIKYEVRVAGSTEVVSDRYVLQQALALILDNAIYWASRVHRKRCLNIQVGNSIISISNNGPAIEKRNIDHIFEPGFTTRKDATGMGLAVARDLLKSIGARVFADLPKDGVRFRIVLPSL